MNTSSDTQHQSTTPDPGVTTPPTDEQRLLGDRLGFRLQAAVLVADRQAARDDIAQALADAVAEVHSEYAELAEALRRADERLAAVLALHARDKDGDCEGCYEFTEWPCATALAGTGGK